MVGRCCQDPITERQSAKTRALKALDPDDNQVVPPDIIAFSASVLDPDISLAAADYQIEEMARFL
jgi:K+-transporting ATPase ATPase C chain